MMVAKRSMAFTALALVLAGCGASEPEGARLTVTVIGDAERPAGLAKRLEAEATRPTLVARDGAGQIVSGLATSWRFVDDGRSLILRLRPAKWSDGKELTSNDVVAAFRRAASKRDPAVANSGLAGSRAITAGRVSATRLGVMAPIARVVELRLDAASPLLLGWLAEPGLGVTRFGKIPPTLAAYDASGPSVRRRLTRRGIRAAPDQRPAEIIIESRDDAKPAVAAFVQGKTDIVIGDGLAGLGEARTAARPEALRIDPLWGVYGYVANGLRGDTADSGVRRALAMAIDRTALSADFGIAAIAPADGLLPQGLAGAQPTARRKAVGTTTPPAVTGWADLDQDARLVEARRLLAAAGWSEARPLRLVLLLPPGRDHRSVAEKVAADWARIGVLLAVTIVDAATHDRLLARGDFDLALTEASMAVPDAGALLGRWQCGAGPYCNVAADALLGRARLAPPAERAQLLAAAETEMMAAPPMIPLFTPIRWALVARGVDGWVPNRAASHPLARLAVTGKR